MRNNNFEEITEQSMSRRNVLKAIGAGTALAGIGAVSAKTAPAKGSVELRGVAPILTGKQVAHVVADPTKVPSPVDWTSPRHHAVKLTVRELVAQIEPGATFRFLTFDGQVPGPMIRVRRGDTVSLTLDNPTGNAMAHNLDMHAIYATGGGSAYTVVAPGKSKTETFKALYPGVFIYHCAVSNMDFHISSGMYGMIVVEPHEGLPKVDREFYVGQNEVYTNKSLGTPGRHNFDFMRMFAEDPTYVLLNGATHALTPKRFGAMQAHVGERIRVFMVNGGPNLTSSFHPIGNVWTHAWPQGAIANAPIKYVQTQPVAPGSCFVGEMDLPTPETIKLVDHALTRVAHKGLLAEIHVAGAANPAVYKA